MILAKKYDRDKILEVYYHLEHMANNPLNEANPFNRLYAAAGEVTSLQQEAKQIALNALSEKDRIEHLTKIESIPSHELIMNSWEFAKREQKIAVDYLLLNRALNIEEEGTTFSLEDAIELKEGEYPAFKRNTKDKELGKPIVYYKRMAKDNNQVQLFVELNNNVPPKSADVDNTFVTGLMELDGDEITRFHGDNPKNGRFTVTNLREMQTAYDQKESRISGIRDWLGMNPMVYEHDDYKSKFLRGEYVVKDHDKALNKLYNTKNIDEYWKKEDHRVEQYTEHESTGQYWAKLYEVLTTDYNAFQEELMQNINSTVREFEQHAREVMATQEKIVTDSLERSLTLALSSAHTEEDATNALELFTVMFTAANPDVPTQRVMDRIQPLLTTRLTQLNMKPKP